MTWRFVRADLDMVVSAIVEQGDVNLAADISDDRSGADEVARLVGCDKTEKHDIDGDRTMKRLSPNQVESEA